MKILIKFGFNNIFMRKSTALLVLLFTVMISSFSIAQNEVYTAENDGWMVNLEEAYDVSKESGKPILANFTGTDWCGWCKRLTANVFRHDEFKLWADKNVVLLELDYPRRKQLPDAIRSQNAGLRQAFKIAGYPTIWVFDLDKNENGQFAISALGKTGYAKTIKDFTSGIDKMIARRNP